MEFDLASLAVHLIEVELSVMRKAETALEKSAEVIEKAAKAELGHYQPATGPFPAWPDLAPSTLAQHAAVGVGDSPLLVHGALYGSIQREVRDGEAVIGSTSDIAQHQEFGTEKIPPRPFIGPAEYASRPKVEKIMRLGLVDALTGGNALSHHDVTRI